MPGDQAIILVGLMKGDSIIAATDSCTFKIDSTISEFTYLEFPIAIQSSLLPDSVLIMVASGLGSGQVGTELIVDEITFKVGGSTAVLEEEIFPSTFFLNQNYPNPFNPSTSIQYQIAGISQVTLKVYDVLGNEVATLVNEAKPAGSYEVNFNASKLSSGIYFYKLQAGTFLKTKKMILMK
ncbi:MAG: T9SS type A sorting domain-containing protein [Ignavibacterium sp.]|nr:T9SS type A sorting domain-containing protein [Ignavibacterium sp.]